MTISYAVVKSIFNTLPIGYYLGRNIDCELSETENASYFDTRSDKIVISYPMIADASTEITAIESNDEIEKLIRGLLYHEISHVILTPNDMKMNTVLNIVEDERIESVCRSLYMNTDFFDNLIKINHFNGEPATNVDSAFYQLVRFHIGTEEWKERSRNLIKTYANLNCNSYCGDYIYDVKEFYNDFVEWYNEKASKEDSNPSESSEDETASDTTSTCSQSTTSETTKDNESNSTSNPFTGSDKSEANNDTETSVNSNESDENTESSMTSATESSTPAKHSTVLKPEEIDDVSIDIDEFKAIVNDSINRYYNETLINTLTSIINKALRKNKRNGSAINSYSGKFNPRAVTRDDYRWWVQQNREGHVRHNSNVHFNLFIDNSGSFYRNDEKMNQFIKALDKVEKSIPNFNFDVITINTRVNEWPNHNFIFESHGGNKLLPEIKDVIKRHTMPQTTNYNIVLFDGDAHSDDEYGYGRPRTNDPFKFFNLPNTIIISDSDNREYMDAVHMTQAKVRYTNNYCVEFINIICNLLEKAL